MASIDINRTVAEITHAVPGAARAFERLGIDYCCRGQAALRDAVAGTTHSIDQVLLALESAVQEPPERAVPTEPVALIRHIVDVHHAFTRAELARLLPLAAKVERVKGARHPQLARVKRLVELLAADLEPHMLKEEIMLFPHIERLAGGGGSAAPFGSVRNPISVMHMEHETVGALLEELEAVTQHYQPPAEACASFRALYRGLAELQADIHRHVHLENHLLFPQALRLEESHELFPQAARLEQAHGASPAGTQPTPCHERE